MKEEMNPVVEEQVEEVMTEDVQMEESETEEIVENVEVEEDLPDSVREAQELNKKLKAELEELKTRNTNVFEENAVLQAELDEQRKLAEMAKENAQIKAQLESIKKNALIDGMVAMGQLTNDLRDWAGNLNLQQLEVFSKSAPKQKSILDQKNVIEDDPIDEGLRKWHSEKMKSRIL